MMEEYSDEGNEILAILHKATNFTEWMYEQIQPYLDGKILEIGSGRGSYSKKISRDFPNNRIILSDIDNAYVDRLNTLFPVQNISAQRVDFGNPAHFDALPTTVDSAFALNVLEHVKDDVQALKNIYSKLTPGGRVTLLVPCHKFLFNTLDESVGHYRRYTKKDMLEKVAKTSFEVEKLFYFNFPSIFGWYWNGNIQKKRVLNSNAVSLFNTLVPVFRLIEQYIFRKRLGISLIVVLRKPINSTAQSSVAL